MNFYAWRLKALPRSGGAFLLIYCVAYKVSCIFSRLNTIFIDFIDINSIQKTLEIILKFY